MTGTTLFASFIASDGMVSDKGPLGSGSLLEILPMQSCSKSFYERPHT